MNKAKRVAAAGLMICMLLGQMHASAEIYQYGDTDDVIADAQEILKNLKLYTGSITGHFGSRTEAAVKAFQKKYALEQNGMLDEETVDALYEVGGGSESDTVIQISGTLRLGDEGSAVLELQKNLYNLGYYSGNLTGHFGSLTKAAVQKFQKAYSLTADGVAGSKTLSAISSRVGIQSDGEEESNSTSLLQLGSKSEAVRTLQENLKVLGYYSGSITGSFGNLTKSAVIAFQKAKGLSADGIAGSKTFRLVERLV